ncbi:MAG: glycosyltransferase family 61 protein [Verrucomicrobia bacterium]|nr:glycosyltransferase family 61 protein [Verrucomicrobiota bacterium]
MIVLNLRAASTQLQSFVRRQKWRARPLKRVVLPLRQARRLLKRLWSTPPRSESSTLAYADAHPEVSVREIFPAEMVKLPPLPFAPTAGVREEVSRPAFVFEIPNITFWAYYGGAVVTADNALLGDLSPDVWGAKQHPIFSQWRLPAAKLLGGRTAIALTAEAAGNYYHWMLDLLPRLFLLKHASGNFSGYDQILINGTGASYERESLAALKVPAEKVRYVDAQHRFQIASAVIPSMDHHTCVIAPWKVSVLRQLVSASEHERRIYISRRRAAVRRVLNEDELAGVLRSHGFEVLALEDFSWCKQVRIFSQAAAVIAPHGAALANAVFCAPGAQLIELSTRAGYRNWFWQLAAAAALRYRCIEAIPAQRSSSRSHAHENDDMLVDCASIAQALAGL